MKWPFLAFAVVVAVSVVARAQSPSPTPRSTRPNVVVIVADDLGYADAGFQGSRDIRTPNLDALAGNAARFTAAYVSCPFCAPSRAGLLTGRYQQRYGFEYNNAVGLTEGFGLNLNERTLADSLRAAGYVTAAFGKWHLGDRDGYFPTDRGFDEFFGHLDGAQNFFPVPPGQSDGSLWDEIPQSHKLGLSKQLIHGRR